MILNFTDPFFTTRVLGFEPLFDRLQRLSESNERSSSYPPYNISKDGNLFSIEIDLKYKLTRCFGYGGTELTNEDAITLEQRGFKVNDIVYSVDKQVCYRITGTAGSIGNAVYVNIDYKLDSCSMCTNASSDNSSSSGSISSQSPPPPTGF